MSVVSLVVLLSGPATGRASTAAVPASVTAEIARVMAKPPYAASQWGIAIRDLRTGDLLYGLNADRMFVPGSLMKVYSTAAALRAYGPRYRFRTPVYRDGRVIRGVLHGNLDLVASGDFSMGLRERRDGTLAFNNWPDCDHNYADIADSCGLVRGNPLRGVEVLAARVRAAGIHRVDGNVVIDARLFRAFNGWPDGLISPIWTNENVIDVTTAASRPGQPARTSWRPRVAGYRVRSSVRTVRRGGATNLSITSSRGLIRLSGTIAADSPPVLKISHISDPAAFARAAFIQALRRQGVTVRAPLTGSNPARLLPRRRYRRADLVGQYVSAPLAQFVKVILNVSYNRGADLMVCLAAARAGRRDCEGGLPSLLQNSTNLGVNPLSTFIFDGAGSDDNDKTTPGDVTTFMRGAAQQPWGNAFRDALAVLGRTGTLADVLPHSPAAGHVQLKDGTRAAGSPITGQTLLTAKTVGGYVTARSGRQLAIAIFINNVPINSLEAVHAVAEDQGAIAAAVQQAY